MDLCEDSPALGQRSLTKLLKVCVCCVALSGTQKVVQSPSVDCSKVGQTPEWNLEGRAFP